MINSDIDQYALTCMHYVSKNGLGHDDEFRSELRVCFTPTRILYLRALRSFHVRIRKLRRCISGVIHSFSISNHILLDLVSNIHIHVKQIYHIYDRFIASFYWIISWFSQSIFYITKLCFAIISMVMFILFQSYAKK